MSDYKFTRGDWRVAMHAYNDHWRGDGTEVLSDYGRIAETSVNGLRDPDECRANALLISAAPDLLVALEMIAANIRLGIGVSQADLDAARDATNKALGFSHDTSVKS